MFWTLRSQAGHWKPQDTFWGHSPTYTNSTSGWKTEGAKRFWKGNIATLLGWHRAHHAERCVTDLPVRCSSSQSPWPPPPCPPSWGVSPFICTFSPPEYMFFLGKKAGQSEARCVAWRLHKTQSTRRSSKPALPSLSWSHAAQRRLEGWPAGSHSGMQCVRKTKQDPKESG